MGARHNQWAAMFSPDEIDAMTPEIREEIQDWLLVRYFARKRAAEHAPSCRGMPAPERLSVPDPIYDATCHTCGVSFHAVSPRAERCHRCWTERTRDQDRARHAAYRVARERGIAS